SGDLPRSCPHTQDDGALQRSYWSLTRRTLRLGGRPSTRTGSPFSTTRGRGDLLASCNLDESSERFVDRAPVRKYIRHIRLEQNQCSSFGRLRLVFPPHCAFQLR